MLFSATFVSFLMSWTFRFFFSSLPLFFVDDDKTGFPSSDSIVAYVLFSCSVSGKVKRKIKVFSIQTFSLDYTMICWAQFSTHNSKLSSGMCFTSGNDVCITNLQTREKKTPNFLCAIISRHVPRNSPSPLLLNFTPQQKIFDQKTKPCWFRVKCF